MNKKENDLFLKFTLVFSHSHFFNYKLKENLLPNKRPKENIYKNNH